MEFAAAAALGLLWGSFLNVVIYRLPQTAAADLGARGARSLAFPRLAAFLLPEVRRAHSALAKTSPC